MAYHNFGNNLIDCLIGYGNDTVDELRQILEIGRYDLNKLDASNRTPLYHVVSDCHADYSQLDEKDNNKKPHIVKAQLLLNHGANPNIKDRHGWTIIHQCAVTGNLPMLQVFIRGGGVVNMSNNNGKLPLDLAILKHHQPIVDYLEKQSCSLKQFCRHSIREAMGKRTYNKINELPIPPTLKLFVNYQNPYPGFLATVMVPRPWSKEEILNGKAENEKVKIFFEENASIEFNTEKKTGEIGPKTSIEELAVMMENLYFWESFKTIEYEDQPARPPRYRMTISEMKGCGLEDDNGDQPAKPFCKHQ